MKIKYLKESAGVKAGTERELPEGLAKQLISMGIIEEVIGKSYKEEAPVLETKEEKSISNRKTKSKK